MFECSIRLPLLNYFVFRFTALKQHDFVLKGPLARKCILFFTQIHGCLIIFGFYKYSIAKVANLLNCFEISSPAFSVMINSCQYILRY